MASRVTRSARQQPQQNEQQNRARWTASLVKTLTKLMVKQVYKGNRLGNSFGKEAWTEICDDFYRRTGLRWDMEQLKNRYSGLRKQYVLVKSLLDRSYFAWDENSGTIVGNELAWAECIREYPDAEALKTNGCPIYKELCVIFSEPEMNGNHDQSAELIKESTPNLHQPVMHLELSSESVELDNIDRVAAQRATVRKRGRKGIDDAIADAILEMAAASKMKTAAIQRRDTRYSITKCIEELDKTQGVDERLYFAALDLFNKPVAREMFMSLKGKNRLIWLQSKCVAYSTMQ